MLLYLDEPRAFAVLGGVKGVIGGLDLASGSLGFEASVGLVLRV